MWNHGLFKALLFFGAGSVLHATGTREMSRLGGLWRAMPWTAAMFALGAVAISSLPPLNGFVSEWLLYLGLLDVVSSRGPAAWTALPAVLALALAGALALASFTKAGAIVFLGAPRSRSAAHAHECGGWMRAAMGALGGGCVAIGLAPAALWPFVLQAVATWNPEWAAEAASPLPALATLGRVHVALALLAAVFATLLLWRARANGLARAVTWDCGYAAPTARMQYTSGSFASLAGGWFFWILRPERKLRRPRGFFPAGASLVGRVPETVLEGVLVPVSGAVLRLSTAVRRLQHGRLQSYIFYLLTGLAAVVALVAWGGMP